jgi:hypothetical protein
MSALRTGRLYPAQEVFLVLVSVRDRVYPSAIRRPVGFIPMKISIVTIRNGTRDLTASSVVSQSTAQPRAPRNMENQSIIGDLPEILSGELPKF